MLARYRGLSTTGRRTRRWRGSTWPTAAATGSARYSLGMKQRLGVAAALLGEPDLLILDEPTNGLDPAGMAAMRTLVVDLAAGGQTVLLSSHLLAEVQQICDRVGVIAGGRLMHEGTVDQMRGGAVLRGARRTGDRDGPGARRGSPARRPGRRWTRTATPCSTCRPAGVDVPSWPGRW